MDDLEFRRRAYAEPDCRDAEFVAYKKKSSENIKFVEELRLLDEKLKQSLCIQPPEDLVQRIKLQQTLGDHQSTRQRLRIWSAAASVLLAIVITFTYFAESTQLNDQEIAANVLQHIYYELDHLQERQTRTLTQVNNILAEFGVNMTGSIGEVNYLGSCNIANKKGVHMVVQGDTGPVTVMVLPDVALKREQFINDSRFKGLIMPVYKGSIAIIGGQSEPLQSLQEKLTEHMRWI